MSSQYATRFGSLADYEKGRVEIIDDDPRRYAFSNIFEVASGARPYEKVVVGKNRQYVIEAIRAEGTSEWRTAGHDEFATVMDGEVEISLRKLGEGESAGLERGSRRLDGEPTGPEVVSARDLFARTLDWVEKNGREIVAEESKRHMPEWRPRFNPDWDA